MEKIAEKADRWVQRALLFPTMTGFSKSGVYYGMRTHVVRSGLGKDKLIRQDWALIRSESG